MLKISTVTNLESTEIYISIKHTRFEAADDAFARYTEHKNPRYFLKLTAAYPTTLE
jgi:hypothetical protein